MVKEIQLTRGLFAKIDDADFESVSQFNWAAVKGSKSKIGIYYAYRNVGGK
jgi:hypothetical protein